VKTNGLALKHDTQEVIMREPVLTHEGQETLEGILSIKLPFVREKWEQRILQVLSLLMTVRGQESAGRELVIEASELVMDKGSGYSIYMMRDPDEFRQNFSQRYIDEATYFAGPYPVKRWPIPQVTPDKRSGQMKVTAFCASPRKSGNTVTLIDEALRGAADAGATVEKIRLIKLNLKYCIGCYKCEQPNYRCLCSQNDDLPLVYQKMKESDAVIFGFPIYDWRECALQAIFIERVHCFRFSPFPAGKRGMMICTWGLPYVDAYELVMERALTQLSRIRINFVEVLTACGFVGIHHGLDEKKRGIIARFPEEMTQAYQAGRSLVSGGDN